MLISFPRPLLAAITLVYNMVLAPIILKERIGRRDIIATIIIVFGVVMAIVFG